MKTILALFALALTACGSATDQAIADRVANEPLPVVEQAPNSQPEPQIIRETTVVREREIVTVAEPVEVVAEESSVTEACTFGGFPDFGVEKTCEGLTAKVSDLEGVGYTSIQLRFGVTSWPTDGVTAIQATECQIKSVRALAASYCNGTDAQEEFDRL